MKPHLEMLQSFAPWKSAFIRLVSAEGNIRILDQTFHIGKRLRFPYVKATIETQRQVLKVYHKGRLIKSLAYKLLKD